MDWQPIETAPLNQKVIVWSHLSYGRGRIGFGALSQYSGSGDKHPYWSIDGSREKARRFPPTHWMPLPPPPYATKGDSDGDDDA